MTKLFTSAKVLTPKRMRHQIFLRGTLVVSLLGMLGSFSLQTLGAQPCIYCWILRVLVTTVFFASLVGLKLGLKKFAFWLVGASSLVGVLVAGYQIYMESSGSHSFLCGIAGLVCSNPPVIFGFTPSAYALTLFSAILGFSMLSRKPVNLTAMKRVMRVRPLALVLMAVILTGIVAASAFSPSVDPVRRDTSSAGSHMSSVYSLASKIDPILDSGKMAFVYFDVDWCHFCQRETPIIDGLESLYSDDVAFIRVDGDENAQILREFGVSGYPAMFLISEKSANGYLYKDFSGFNAKSLLKMSIDGMLAVQSMRVEGLEGDGFRDSLATGVERELERSIVSSGVERLLTVGLVSTACMLGLVFWKKKEFPVVGRRVGRTVKGVGLGLILVFAMLHVPWIIQQVYAPPVEFNIGDVFAGVGNGTIRHFDAYGNLRKTLDTTSDSDETTGMAFDDAGNLYATNFDNSTMSKFNKWGGLLEASWGGPFDNNWPESVVVDADGNLYTGEVKGVQSKLRKWNSTGYQLGEWSPKIERIGVDWIDLAADQHTMFYTSEHTGIMRFSVSSGTQLPDFARLPNDSRAYALRILRGGGVLVAAHKAVYRLNASGVIDNIYLRTDYNETSFFFALNLDPDGTSFWTAGFHSGNIYRIDIATGGLITSFNAGKLGRGGSLAGLAIYGEPTAARPPCVQPPSDLVSWWPGDGNAIDIWDGNDGTLMSGTTFAPGKVGLAFSFDGVDDHVKVPDDPSLNFGEKEDFTIDAWIFWDAFSVMEAPIAAKWNGEVGYYFFILDGNLALVLADGVGFPFFTEYHSPVGPLMPTGQWLHVAVSVDRDDPTGLRFYVNGTPHGPALDPTGRLGSLVNTEQLRIGATPFPFQPGYPQFFNGLIDEVEIFNRALTASEVQTIYSVRSAGKCKCVEPPTGVVSWWPLDETLGIVAADIVGPNHGTHIDGPVPTPGMVDGALRFNGVDQHVEVPNHPTLNFGTGDFSIDTWVKTNSTGIQPIVDKRIAKVKKFSKIRGYYLFLSNGSLGFELHGGTAANTIITSANVGDGNWHLVTVAVSRSTNTGRLYVDYNIVWAFNPVPGNINNNADLLIGASYPIPSGTGNFFNGEIDEVEIFNRALTASEVFRIFDAGSMGKCKPKCVEAPSDLISWWPLDETLGIVAADIVGPNHGTHIDGPVPTPGMVDGALRFNGVDQHVQVPNHPTLNFGTGDFSIDAWINPDDEKGFLPIVEKREKNSTGIYGYTLFLRSPASGGPLVFGMNDGASMVQAWFNPIPTEEWTHVAVTVNRTGSNEIKIYINGNIEVTKTVPGTFGSVSNTAPLFIGGDYAGHWFFDGLIDEVEIFNRALTASEVFRIFYSVRSAGKCKCVDAPSDMVSWWPADGDAQDIVDGNGGTLMDDTTFAPGKVGLAFSFDGVDDYVKVPDSPNLKISGSITVDAWFKTETAEVWQTIVSKYKWISPTEREGYWLGLSPANEPVFYIEGITSSIWCTGTSQVADNRWHHIAGTLDGTDMRVYLDGILETTCKGEGIITGTQDLWIGNDVDDETFTGLIDEVEIFNRALTASEVFRIFDAGSAGKCPLVIPT